MSKFAVMNNNVVQNIIVADTKEIAETITKFSCIEYTDDTPVTIGFIYNAETNTFINPLEPIIVEDNNA